MIQQCRDEYHQLVTISLQAQAGPSMTLKRSQQQLVCVRVCSGWEALEQWGSLGPLSHRRGQLAGACALLCVCVWLICFAHCIGNPLAPAVLLSVAFSMVCFCIAFVCVCVLVWQLEFHSAGLSLCSPASNNELCLCTVGAIFTQEHTTHRSQRHLTFQHPAYILGHLLNNKAKTKPPITSRSLRPQCRKDLLPHSLQTF